MSTTKYSSDHMDDEIKVERKRYFYFKCIYNHKSMHEQ